MLIEELITPSDKKILLLVLDGLGGLPREAGGPTELEAAHTPHLDELARDGSLGLLEPLGPGISVGSAPGHLALFGYDPVERRIGRGLLAALGIDFELHDSDICLRGNFCTLDKHRNVTNRRAGRIPTEESSSLCKQLEEEVDLGDVEAFVRPVADHRFLLVLRGQRLSDRVTDTDGRLVNEPPKVCRPLREEAARTAGFINEFTRQSEKILAGREQANGVLLRGAQKKLPLPSLNERFGLHTAAAADYPMYRGLAKLAGFEIIGSSPDRTKRFTSVTARYSDFDFFYVHDKEPDVYGEDGDFDGKVAAIEAIDMALPKLLTVQWDVLAVTADHSTPAVMGEHSWHPAPVLIHGPFVRQDECSAFSEHQAVRGALGRFQAVDLMPLLLAHSLRLGRFGP